MNAEAIYSHTVPIDSLGSKGKRFVLTPNADEREAMTNAYKLLSLDSFSAEVTLSPMHHDLVRLEGQIEAEITQACVVTLEPVKEQISATFERVFAPIGEGEELHGFAWTDEEEVELDRESDGSPEPYGHGVIDIGAVVSEQLSLEINPFPRLEGAEFEGLGDAGQKDEDARPNPFAILAQLKDKK